MCRWTRVAALVGCVLAAGCAGLFSVKPLGQRIVETRSADTLFLDVRPIQRTATWLWDNASSKEWIGCVQGRMIGDTVVAEAIELADILYSDSISANGVCRTTTQLIGRIHPHKGPWPTDWSCQQSEVDFWTYVREVGSAFDFIVCDRQTIWVGTRKVPNTRPVPLDSVP